MSHRDDPPVGGQTACKERLPGRGRDLFSLPQFISASNGSMNPRAFWNKATAPTAARIGSLELSTAKRVNIIAGALGACFAVLTGGAFLTGLVKELGGTEFQIGLLGATITLTRFIQIPASLLIERLPRLKFYWFFTVITHRLVWVVVVLLPLFLASHISQTAVWIVIAVSVVSWLLADASTPAWLAWMGALVPETQRGSFFGRRQAYVQFAIIVVTLLSGVFLDLFPEPSKGGTFLGYMIIFGMGSLLGCIDIILHMLIPEPVIERTPPSIPLYERLVAPLKDRSFRHFIWVMGTFTFAAQLTNPFGVVYCLDDLGVSWSFLISTLGTLNLLSAILGSLLWGWVAQRYGHKPVLVLTLCIGMANTLLWFVVSDVPVVMGLPGWFVIEFKSYYLVLILLHLIGGMTWSGFTLASFNLLLGLSPESGRAIYTAVFSTITGAFGTLGPLVGGAVAEYVRTRSIEVVLIPGLAQSWWHLLLTIMLGCWVVTLVLAARLPRPQETPSGIVLSRLVSGNPFRTFLHLYTIHASTNPGKRAHAVRCLGESRSALAVRDLIDALNDPDWQVREQSALSLGMIGDDTAISALAAQLKDPASDVRVQAARSLGRLGGPTAARALLQHLDDPSREVRLHVARSLSALAYPPAARFLEERLVVEPDANVRAAVATALGRLGNLKPILDMISALAAAQVPRAREEIARAIGQLLCGDGTFERLLRGEQRSPGSAAGRLLSQIENEVERGLEAIPDAARLCDERIAQLRVLCETEGWAAAANVLRELVEVYARHRHEVFTGDIDALSLRLFVHDWLLGACLFYVLSFDANRDSDLPDPTGVMVLLGLFFFYRATAGHENGNSV